MLGIRFPVAFLTLIAVFSSAVSAGPVLDDMLNYIKFDQCCPQDTQSDGLVLVSDGGKMNTTVVTVSKDRPAGQSFRVGSDAGVLWRVSIGAVWFDDSWQEDEKLTFTLYDGPQKGKKLFSREIDYTHKWHKWDLPFDVRIPCKPDQEFYWEVTHNGAGDDSIGMVATKDDAYPRGQAYIAGQTQPYDLYFKTLVKPANPDRTANLQKFFDNFDLDYPPLAKVKAAVQAGDYEAAGRELLEHFRTRTKPDAFPEPKKNPKYDRREADELLRHRIVKMTDRKDIKTGKVGQVEIAYDFTGYQLTWRETNPGVGSMLIRPMDHIWRLAEGYAQTGEEAFLKEALSVMRKFVEDNPSPSDGGQQHVCFYRALNCGWRLSDGWDGFQLIFRDPKADPDILLGWINFMVRMGDFVSWAPSGGNQESEAASGLFSFATRFPELKKSKEWADKGFARLTENTLKTIREDGVCREPAIGYHGMMTATLSGTVADAQKKGYQVPKQIMDRLEGMFDWMATLMQPNGGYPSYGDSDCDAIDGSEPWQGGRRDIRKASELFGRKDWLYIATAGAEGTAPEWLSRGFLKSNYFVMRSDWNRESFKDARYLFYLAGKKGSHGHNDLSQVVVYAYGRPLLIDPGRTSYGTTLMQELTRTSSHNVVIVDNQEMKSAQPDLKTWITNPVMDLADNSYKEHYPGLENRRGVLYVRGDAPGTDYWVIFDTLLGDPQGRRKFDQQFWLAPCPVTVDEATKTVSTNHDKGGNIDLIPIDTAGLSVVQRKGACDFGGVRDDIPVVSFHKEQAAPCAFTTVMYPYPVGKPKPRVTASAMESPDGCRALKVGVGGITDYIVYSTDSDPERPIQTKDGVKFRGSAMVMRVSADGRRVLRLGWSDGKGAVLGDTAIAWSKQPLASLSVRYLGDTVLVDTDKPEPSLAVATQGARKMVINGGAAVDLPKGAKAVKPFAGKASDQ